MTGAGRLFERYYYYNRLTYLQHNVCVSGKHPAMIPLGCRGREK